MQQRLGGGARSVPVSFCYLLRTYCVLGAGQRSLPCSPRTATLQVQGVGGGQDSLLIRSQCFRNTRGAVAEMGLSGRVALLRSGQQRFQPGPDGLSALPLCSTLCP